MMSDKQPWEMRDDETSSSYRAFEIYRDLGPGRSLPKAWEVYATERDLKGVHPGRAFKNWCTGNEWVARCEAFDAFESEARLAQRQAMRDEVRQVFVDESKRVARRLIRVAMGLEPGASSHEVKAAQEVLDRAGVTVPKDLNVDIKGELKTSGWKKGVEELDTLATAELARVFFEAVEDPSED